MLWPSTAFIYYNSKYHFIRIALCIWWIYEVFQLSLSVSMHAARKCPRARSHVCMLMKSLSLSLSSSLFMLLLSLASSVRTSVRTHKIYGVILFSVIFGYILNATIGFMEMSEGRYLNALNLQLKAASSPLLFVPIFCCCCFVRIQFVLVWFGFCFHSFSLGYFHDTPKTRSACK